MGIPPLTLNHEVSQIVNIHHYTHQQ